MSAYCLFRLICQNKDKDNEELPIQTIDLNKLSLQVARVDGLEDCDVGELEMIEILSSCARDRDDSPVSADGVEDLEDPSDHSEWRSTSSPSPSPSTSTSPSPLLPSPTTTKSSP